VESESKVTAGNLKKTRAVKRHADPGATVAPFLSLVVLALVWAWIHWGVWYYLDITLDGQKVLFEAAMGGGIGTMYGVLSERQRTAARKVLARLLINRLLFFVGAGVAVTLFLIGLIVVKVNIRWNAGPGHLYVDGVELLNQNSTDGSQASASVYSIFHKSKILSVGEFSLKLRPYPFVKSYYNVPEGAIFSSEPKYGELTQILLLSLYQYVEGRFLLQAKQQFVLEKTAHLAGLESVYQILSLCLVEHDLPRNGELLLARYSGDYPTSPWLPLLRACEHYSRKEYRDATAELTSPDPRLKSPYRETYVFFRGVNRLRMFMEGMHSHGLRNQADLVQARNDFIEAQAILEKAPRGYFRDVARPSAQIFEGIAYVYALDNEKAAASFEKASSSSYVGLKARALNDLGYVKLLGGDLAAARSDFEAALVADSSFPFARTNLAYSYMAEGSYAVAKRAFLKCIADRTIQAESPRDIALSKISVGYIDIHQRGPRFHDPSVYDEVLRELGVYNYDGTEPRLLRLALIHMAIGKTIESSRDYYGLEIFALAMYAIAHKEAVEVDRLNRFPAAQLVASNASSAFNRIRHSIDPKCFAFAATNGFFKPVAELARAQGLVR
jgi:tetratricopeptide (TPR) repeat protein